MKRPIYLLGCVSLVVCIALIIWSVFSNQKYYQWILGSLLLSIVCFNIDGYARKK